MSNSNPMHLSVCVCVTFYQLLALLNVTACLLFTFWSGASASELLKFFFHLVFLVLHQFQFLCESCVCAHSPAKPGTFVGIGGGYTMLNRNMYFQFTRTVGLISIKNDICIRPIAHYLAIGYLFNQSSCIKKLFSFWLCKAEKPC